MRGRHTPISPERLKEMLEAKGELEVTNRSGRPVEECRAEERPRWPMQPRRRRRRAERKAEGDVNEFGELVIPEGDYIEEGAFRYRPEIVRVKLPETMLYIGKSAFEGCENLQEIVFPEGLKQIGDKAFLRCKSLVKVVIPGSVERVGQMAFYGCEGLEELEIRQGVQSLERLAFGGCKRLVNFRARNLPRSVVRVVDVGRNRKDPIMKGVFDGSPCAMTRGEKRMRRIARRASQEVMMQIL